ncbi:hypothetical protein [Leptospira adleri]|uniref:hypothetical protein n=1 Tax=Leptospira adleri TaxID=2023186 RepID=UPI0010826DA6|nr:hypothetical protein [Leptospira adleri]TGM52934.1 hypothetical protein EHQ97_13545 [Leptospira adleri]
MKMILYPIILILFFVCRCYGIDGPQLIGNSDFEDRKTNIIQWKTAYCFPIDSSPPVEPKRPDLISAILIAGTEALGSLFPKNSAFYLKKDIEFCEGSLLATPCGNSPDEFAINHISTLIQSCEPKIACMGGKDHFATGTFCIDWDR